MTKLTKKELVEIVAESAGCTKKAAKDAVDACFEEMEKTLCDNGVVDFFGFGKLETKKRKARTGVNPATGEKIKIKATKVVSFKAAKALKDAVK